MSCCHDVLVTDQRTSTAERFATVFVVNQLSHPRPCTCSSNIRVKVLRCWIKSSADPNSLTRGRFCSADHAISDDGRVAALLRKNVDAGRWRSGGRRRRMNRIGSGRMTIRLADRWHCARAANEPVESVRSARGSVEEIIDFRIGTLQQLPQRRAVDPVNASARITIRRAALLHQHRRPKRRIKVVRRNGRMRWPSVNETCE